MDKSMIVARSGYDKLAVAAWEAEITGLPQRIEPIARNTLNGEGLKVVIDIRAAVGAPIDAPLPEYCLTMVKHPPIFRCHMEMGTAIFKGMLPARERELAVLRIGWLMRAPYEWGEHVEIGKRNGVTADEIEAVVIGSAAPNWNEHEAAILCSVEEMLSEQAVSDKNWRVLERSWNEQQLIEFTMIVGQYVAIALVQNTLRIRLEPDNPGLSRR